MGSGLRLERLRRKETTLAEAAAAAHDAISGQGEPHEQNASTRFSDHVAHSNNFARKFGHYKHHMTDSTTSDDGSTTADDSQRTGSYALDDSVHRRDQDWQVGKTIPRPLLLLLL